MFCSVTYGNQSFVLSKLPNYLENKHSIHRNKSERFFKKLHDFLGKQKTALQSLITNSSANKNALLLSSFQIAHVLMQQRKPYTKAESVIKPSLKIVANLFHGGKNALEKLQQIPLCNDTMKVRSAMIAEDMKQQLIAKLIKAPCFAMEFDKKTDITSYGQLIVYCRFPNKIIGKIVQHFLCYLPIGLQTAGKFIFSKLDDFVSTKIYLGITVLL